ncbi:MAG TPA: nuclear transport factor 2 family protein [Ohtaekwangia sp.]|uniref:YybH family protein n=1 Tax=Ohtaekwangia sp. TaxID=2066019 RepID=UPI002F944EA6
MRFCSVRFLLLVVLCSCGEKKLSVEEMRAILHERNETLGKLFKEGNADKLVTMYTDSAKLCPNGAFEIYIGKKAIRKFWGDAMEGSELLDMKTETLSVDGSEGIIYETGRTTTRTKYQDSVYVSEVKFANVWKRQSDGTYLLDVDIWNSIKH